MRWPLPSVPESWVRSRAALRAAQVLDAVGIRVVDATPPHARELREVFDVAIMTEARLFAMPVLAGREDELSRYGRALADAAAYASVLGLPAASVPCGRDDHGLPLAVQVIGRRGCDLDVVAVARVLEEALGGALDPDDAPRSATRGLG